MLERLAFATPSQAEKPFQCILYGHAWGSSTLHLKSALAKKSVTLLSCQQVCLCPDVWPKPQSSSPFDFWWLQYAMIRKAANFLLQLHLRGKKIQTS